MLRPIPSSLLAFEEGTTIFPNEFRAAVTSSACGQGRGDLQRWGGHTRLSLPERCSRRKKKDRTPWAGVRSSGSKPLTAANRASGQALFANCILRTGVVPQDAKLTSPGPASGPELAFPWPEPGRSRRRRSHHHGNHRHCSRRHCNDYGRGNDRGRGSDCRRGNDRDRGSVRHCNDDRRGSRRHCRRSRRHHRRR